MFWFGKNIYVNTYLKLFILNLITQKEQKFDKKSGGGTNLLFVCMCEALIKLDSEKS